MENINKLTASQFAKRKDLKVTQVIRMINDGKIKALKKKVEKVQYEIPFSELSKV